jgi:hypothetical protein
VFFGFIVLDNAPKFHPIHIASQYQSFAPDEIIFVIIALMDKTLASDYRESP